MIVVTFVPTDIIHLKLINYEENVFAYITACGSKYQRISKKELYNSSYV